MQLKKNLYEKTLKNFTESSKCADKSHHLNTLSNKGPLPWTGILFTPDGINWATLKSKDEKNSK